MRRKQNGCDQVISYASNRQFHFPLVALLAVVVCLMAIGLILIFDTTSADVLDRSLSTSMYHAVLKQGMFVTLGLVVGIFLFRIGYQECIELSPLLFGGMLFVLALTLLPGIGIEVNGATRWIGAGPFVVQPSEFVKIVMPLFYIYLLRRYTGSRQSFIKLLSMTLTPLPLIFLEPDNGTVLILLMIVCVLLFLSRVRAMYWALPILVFSLVSIGFASQMQHVVDRIQIYLHPEYDLLGKGHQPYQAKIAAGSGGLFGKGPGGSLQKLNYLPEANNDYIGAIFAEEYGYAGVCVLLTLYLGLAFTGYTIAMGAVDSEGYYLASILTFLLTFQAFLNLGIVSGLLPSTGTTLPFISQGGSSLIANCIAVSLLASVAAKKGEV